MMTRGAVQLSRVQPGMPAQNYKTYGMVMPLKTHFRKVSCAEYECDQYRMGFDTVVDISTEIGRKQYDFITHDKTRSYKATKEGTALVRFHFSPGTKPFAGPKHDHFTRVDRPPLFVVRGGDWRGNPRGVEPMLHKDGLNWADDFANHQDKLVRAMS